jgi:NTE family protein
MNMRSLVAVISALALASCAFFRQNPPLQHYDPSYGYRFSNLTHENPAQLSPNFIIVSLSGGGTRAAALAYGTLAQMNRDQIGNGRTLFDEVDVISSVSGGSFASAYLGAFGKERFINHFRDDVLYRQIQRDVIVRLLEPWNWLEWMFYGRSDIAESYYNSEIFANQTYQSIPRRRPYIILNATDISWGARFEFTQESFDRMCSDLSRFQSHEQFWRLPLFLSLSHLSRSRTMAQHLAAIRTQSGSERHCRILIERQSVMTAREHGPPTRTQRSDRISI